MTPCSLAWEMMTSPSRLWHRGGSREYLPQTACAASSCSVRMTKLILTWQLPALHKPRTPKVPISRLLLQDMWSISYSYPASGFSFRLMFNSKITDILASLTMHRLFSSLYYNPIRKNTFGSCIFFTWGYLYKNLNLPFSSSAKLHIILQCRRDFEI